MCSMGYLTQLMQWKRHLYVKYYMYVNSQLEIRTHNYNMTNYKLFMDDTTSQLVTVEIK
jgi:hypothetical protein